MASEQYLKERRLQLHNKLVEILGSDNVYFQPPESVKLQYPAIVYERSSINNPHASNQVYLIGCDYRITIIDKSPVSDVVEKMSRFPTANFSRHYVDSNLNYDVFIIKY